MTNKIPIYNKESEIIDYFIVDPEDYYEINKVNWSKSRHYVQGYINNTTITVHQHILGKMENMIIDHIDGNRLNNTRKNLHFVNKSQNVQNKSSKENSSSKYIGVSLRTNLKWIVTSHYNKKYINLGYFTYPI